MSTNLFSLGLLLRGIFLQSSLLFKVQGFRLGNTNQNIISFDIVFFMIGIKKLVESLSLKYHLELDALKMKNLFTGNPMTISSFKRNTNIEKVLEESTFQITSENRSGILEKSHSILWR